MKIPTSPLFWCRLACLLAAGVLLAVWGLGAVPEKWQRALTTARAAPGTAWPWQAYGALWLPRAAGVDALLLLIVAGLAGWFLRKAPVLPVRTALAPPGPRWLAPLVIALTMLVSAWLNIPRMHASLWKDEEFSMSHFMVGEYIPGRTGGMAFTPAPWARAIWDHRVPNNHATYSLLAKLAHTGHVPSLAAGEVFFSEWRLRLPAFLAALFALPVLYALMKELGLPRAGLAAVVLMAAHPWFVRYSTEARGYGLLFLWWPLAVLCLLKGLRTGKWRWWLGWGLLQMLLLSSWTGTVHWLLALNAAALGLLFFRRLPEERFQFRRWLAAGALATICYLPLGLPMLPQLQAWMATGRAKAPGIAPRWLADSTSLLLSGEPWHSPDASNPLCPGRLESFTLQPWPTVVFLLAGGLTLLWGIAVFSRHSRETRWLLLAMLLPLGTMYVQALITGNVLLPWYACPALPALAMLLAAPVETLLRRTMAIPARCLLLAACLLSGHRMRTLLRQHDLEPNRPAAALTRPILNPRHPDYQNGPITVQFSSRCPGYDPGSRDIDSVGELEALRMEALTSGRDCFVNIGDVALAASRWPEIMKRLNDPAFFKNIATLHGMDHAQTRMVWQAVR